MASPSPLPPTPNVQDVTKLDYTLGLLLEPSPALHNLLVPAIHSRISNTSKPTNYSDLIDLCAEEIKSWDMNDKAVFLGGHPLIGEVKGLSALSTSEQGGEVRTPEVVLKRLAHLNALYSTIYSGLPYITFVNGRPRSAIITEMEEAIAIPTSPVPLPDDYPTDQPALQSEQVQGKMVTKGSEEWMKECERALGDIWLIAKSRVTGMGLR